MGNEEIKKYTGYPAMTIVEAMQKIDITGRGILFIVNEQNQLIGSLTDGDIRRWLIRTGNLNANVSQVMCCHPYSLMDIHKDQAMDKMLQKKIRALPILNDRYRIVDIIFNSYDDKENFIQVSEVLKDIPVVIMAGGKGERLLPYTYVLPKPLIPIGDKPILERIIDQFYMFGCRRFYLVLNYKKNMIKAYFNESSHKYEICYIEEEEPLGTGGGLALLKGKIKGTFILSNCDVLIDDDFFNIYDFHKKSRNKISMICSLKNFKIPYGIVHLGTQGTVESMEEKPTISFFTNTGCYVIDSEILDEISMDTPIGVPEIIDEYRKKGNEIGVYPINESKWLDMGQLDELEKMKKRFGEI